LLRYDNPTGISVSDVESSLQVEPRTVAAQPMPVSDVASSLQVTQRSAAATVGSTVREGGFAWGDAGIGAGMAVLLVVAALGSLALTRRRRQDAA
jgi:hypothetical protein